MENYSILFANGTKMWWVDGQLHRLDGPAVEYADGSKEWYINHKKCTEEDYPRAVMQHVLSVTSDVANILLDCMKD